MKIKLIFHGSLKKYNNNRHEIEINVLEMITVGQLIANTMVPKQEIAFAAVNGSRVSTSQNINEGDEVKLFQIVGGG